MFCEWEFKENGFRFSSLDICALKINYSNDWPCYHSIWPVQLPKCIDVMKQNFGLDN